MGLNSLARGKTNYHLRAFLLGLGLAFLMFIPFIIIDNGIFIYYGDYIAQQIPFYQLAHDSIKSGNIGWSYITDLGSNFIGSYSFYLLGSPFFWLTIPFPSEAVEYLMGPLLMLKFACASLTAYTYLNRYVKNKNFAVIGAILYAFSGYSVYNVFFNHFHEAVVIFPILLYAIDEYMETRRRGLVAFAVCFACIFNYYFFVGQVVFAIIYFFVKLFAGSIKINFKDLCLFAIECVIGLGMSAILLLPSVFTVLQNDRVANPINGWDAILYDNVQRYLHIIQSLFFIPDIPARPNFTPDSNAKWASLGAWMPLFGMVGTTAWLIQRKKHWLKKLIIVLLVFAFVPGLNSAFQLFNAVFYVRWFYMLTLMLALATIMSLDANRVNWKRAIKINTYIIGVIVLLVGLMPSLEEVDGEEVWTIGLYDYTARFWAYAGIAFICLGIVILLLKGKKKENFARNCLIAVSVVSVSYGIFFLAMGKSQSSDPDKQLIPYALNGGENLELEDLYVSRSDFYESDSNTAMYWQIPTIQAFHSVVTGSIMDFYDFVGIYRGVSSSPTEDEYALRGLLSVKWLFDDADDKDYFGGEDYDAPLMRGFSYYGTENGFDIWLNEYYIPMGFSYDYYILESDAEEISEGNRDSMMLQAIVIPDEDEEIWSQYLTEIEYVDYTNQAYYDACTERAESACEFFEYTNTGFTAINSSDTDEIVFFSVPYEDGWSATVNGEDAEILLSNIGFMSVIVPAGDDVVIEFNYVTPWLFEGICITAISVVCLVVYIIFAKKHYKNK